MSFFSKLSSSSQLSFNHLSFASLHLYLISLSNLLYSFTSDCLTVFLLSIRSNFSVFIHFWFSCFSFLGMYSSADLTTASHKIFHLPVMSLLLSLFFSRMEYLFFTLLEHSFCSVSSFLVHYISPLNG